MAVVYPELHYRLHVVVPCSTWCWTTEWPHAGITEAVDMQTSAEAVQRRDAAVLAAVHDAIQAAAAGEGAADTVHRVAALQLAQAQTEAQLVTALTRCDAQQLRAAALQAQLQVLLVCHSPAMYPRAIHLSMWRNVVLVRNVTPVNCGWIVHCVAMQEAKAAQESFTPHAHVDPMVLDIATAHAASPDMVHTAHMARLEHRAEAAEAQAAAAEEARLVAEEALQRLADCDARLLTDNVHMQQCMA
jgi:hypothetical protein